MNVGWKPSTVPEPLSELSELPKTSSMNQQLELKGYQQPQLAAVKPASTSDRQQPDLNNQTPPFPPSPPSRILVYP